MPNGTYGGVRGKETKIGRKKKKKTSFPYLLNSYNVYTAKFLNLVF